MYAAFARGDIAGVLAHLSDDIDWRLNIDPNAPGAKSVTTARAFRGRAQVQEFFAIVGHDLEIHSFEQKSFLAGENEVAVRVVEDITVRETGRRVRIDSIHLFTFDATGRVTRFREYLDTLLAADAWGAVQEKR